MSKRSQTRERSRRPRAPTAAARPLAAQLRQWLREQAAAVRFVGFFGGAIAVYFLLTVSLATRDPAEMQRRPVLAAVAGAGEWVRDHVLVPYHGLIARGTGLVLRMAGHEAEVLGREVRSPRFAIAVTHGCDGMELSLLYAAAVLAFPAAWRMRLRGLAVGLVVIAALNAVRVVSLWFIGAYWRAAFDFAHFSLWPVILITAALALFAAWLARAAPARPTGAPS